MIHTGLESLTNPLTTLNTSTHLHTLHHQSRCLLSHPQHLHSSPHPPPFEQVSPLSSTTPPLTSIPSTIRAVVSTLICNTSTHLNTLHRQSSCLLSHPQHLHSPPHPPPSEQLFPLSHLQISAHLFLWVVTDVPFLQFLHQRRKWKRQMFSFLPDIKTFHNSICATLFIMFPLFLSQGRRRAEQDEEGWREEDLGGNATPPLCVSTHTSPA